MSKPITLRSDYLELGDILEPGERLLWSGRPAYGRQFFQAVYHERLLHTAFLAAILVMWGLVPFAPERPGVAPNTSILICMSATLAFGAISFGIACTRRLVLSNLVYFVSDKRAILCRKALNWRLQSKLHITASLHQDTSTVLPGFAEHMPLREIRSSLSETQMYNSPPTKGEQPDLWERFSTSIVYEHVPDPQQLLSRTHTSDKTTLY
ncbi:hypothetical protein [Tropicibacter sp. Alg240-R139]|uniref:hypothetical protein n=1 Tax=Tropicibacter sp. Alg240-R139 TaxID=2305991 RepID=UPI0013E00CB2|nr:hypothetical protein [Tropicibacter sp. Alg240-R139]